MPPATSVARPRDAPIVVDAKTDALLTFLFLTEVFLSFYMLAGGCDTLRNAGVSPRAACSALLISLVGVFVLILLVKRASVWLGALFSRHVLSGDPLGKPRQMHKFRDQVWQLGIHVAMTALEQYVLFYEEGTVSWWTDYSTIWVPHPRHGGLCKPSMLLLYVLQMAIWIDTCFGHRFLEERHKDYVMMYLHHIVTIALVGASFYFNYTRIGVLVLYVHDASDIPLDLLKIFNYCTLEGPRYLFLLELDYVATCVSWVYYRFVLFSQIIYYGAFLHGREMMLVISHVKGFAGGRSAPATCMDAYTDALGGPYAWGFARGARFGDGSFDVWHSLRAVSLLNPCAVGWVPFVGLLCTLQAMHAIWYCLLLNIIRKKLSPGTTFHDAGREVYEGESDDEAERKPVLEKKAN